LHDASGGAPIIEHIGVPNIAFFGYPNTNAVELIDCKEYKIISTLKLGPGVDHGVYNPIAVKAGVAFAFVAAKPPQSNHSLGTSTLITI